MRLIYMASALTVALISLTSGSQADATRGLNQRLLDAHNVERIRVGAQPLVWDAGLTENAAQWAAKLAATNQFDHAKQDAEGENLWMGTSASFEPEEMVAGWVEERQHLRSGKFPNVSRTGNWADIGHYTQLIWYNTTKVGCAVSTGHGSDFLVCRYDPPGNWIGTAIRINDSAVIDMQEG